jgi:hypothetical protein
MQPGSNYCTFLVTDGCVKTSRSWSCRWRTTFWQTMTPGGKLHSFFPFFFLISLFRLFISHFFVFMVYFPPPPSASFIYSFYDFSLQSLCSFSAVQRGAHNWLLACLVCCSYDSMKGLCDRYNRAIDSIVQLVSLQRNLNPNPRDRGDSCRFGVQ